MFEVAFSNTTVNAAKKGYTLTFGSTGLLATALQPAKRSVFLEPRGWLEVAVGTDVSTSATIDSKSSTRKSVDQTLHQDDGLRSKVKLVIHICDN